MNTIEVEKYLWRGLAAYFRTGGTGQPSMAGSSVETVEGRRYVVLRNSENNKGILAIYRVRNDDQLKRLKRWPRQLAPSSKAGQVRARLSLVG